MPNISSYGSARGRMDKMQKKRASEAPPKKPTTMRSKSKKKTGMNKPNVRGGMSRSTMVSKPKKRK